MKVRFWGVRGSIPSPGLHTRRYGGNTTCIEVRTDDDSLIILDAGTGIFPLAQELLKQMPIQASIFVTHAHWDHIQGLPFFAPLYVPGNSVRIHGGYDVVSGRGIDQIVDVQLQYSFFPVREAEMKAQIEYRNLAIGESVPVGDATVTALLLNHPVVNLGYRIDCNGKSVFFTGDHEPWANIYEPGGQDHAEFQQMIDLQQRQLDDALAGLDLMIADSSYTATEYPAKVGWGHGSLEGCIAWARRLGVKRLACTHHEPTRSDDDLECAFLNACRDSGNSTDVQGPSEFLLAYEGLELII